MQDRCDPSKQMPVTVNRKELRLHCAIKRLATVALEQQHAQPAERYDERDDLKTENHPSIIASNPSRSATSSSDHRAARAMMHVVIREKL